MSATTTPAVESDARAATRLRLVIGRLGRQLRRSQVGGLTPSQLSALSSVDRHGPIRLGDLAAREHISPSALTPCVASLGKLGLVRREGDPDDRRSVLMDITAQGRKLLDELRRENTASLEERINRLDDAERQSLLAALPVLEKLVEDAPQPER